MSTFLSGKRCQMMVPPDSYGDVFRYLLLASWGLNTPKPYCADFKVPGRSAKDVFKTLRIFTAGSARKKLGLLKKETHLNQTSNLHFCGSYVNFPGVTFPCHVYVYFGAGQDAMKGPCCRSWIIRALPWAIVFWSQDLFVGTENGCLKYNHPTALCKVQPLRFAGVEI